MKTRRSHRRMPAEPRKPQFQEETPDPRSSEFYFDEVDKFHRKREAAVLTGLDDGKGVVADRSQEVLRVRLSDSEEDEQDEDGDRLSADLASSDDDDDGVGADDEKYLPSANAWGRKRSTFYNTDFVDKDYGGYSGSDVDDAEMEEREALTLQKRLAAQLDDADFAVDLPAVAHSTDHDGTPAEHGALSVGQALTVADRVAQLEQQSPELPLLLDDYEAKRDVLQSTLKPILDALRADEDSRSSEMCKTVQAAAEIYANYLLNVGYYVYLKTDLYESTGSSSCKNHPIHDRMMQWKALTAKVDAFVDEFADQLALLKERAVSRGPLLDGFSESAAVAPQPRAELPDAVAEVSDGGGVEEMGDEKRPIDYEISKNRGLTARQKKVNRHSRVKRRKHYDKALIRRRSQVPDVVRELDKYGGEARGIKANVVKSIKLH